MIGGGVASPFSSLKMIASISISAASESLKPSWPKILIPLSRHGLCEAEMTIPAAKARVRARYATPGVVITPALSAVAAAEASPAATDSAICGPDSRVSIPMTTCKLACCRARYSPSARPTVNVVRGSSGNSPATPRIPSVPNRWRAAGWGTLKSPFYKKKIAPAGAMLIVEILLTSGAGGHLLHHGDHQLAVAVVQVSGIAADLAQ